jgi:hypothetical protein
MMALAYQSTSRWIKNVPPNAYSKAKELLVPQPRLGGATI